MAYLISTQERSFSDFLIQKKTGGWLIFGLHGTVCLLGNQQQFFGVRALFKIHSTICFDLYCSSLGGTMPETSSELLR
jgi:hypothetical protein